MKTKKNPSKPVWISLRACICRVALVATAALFAVSCATTELGEYDAPAYRPMNQKNVRVKVSLQNRMVYVMEGNRMLLATPTAIGKPGHETPLGNFNAFNRIEKKRSNTYGYFVKGNQIVPGKSSNTPRGHRYVGFPMPYWVEFKSGYGFHAGSVWPVPRSHGCLRLHPNVAPKFFALVPAGTPINIAQTQPEDQTLGRNVRRPTDYADPDPPKPVMISAGAFPAPKGPIFAGGATARR
ncbi:MAG: L,D-transpeptidase [Verrucomicrobiota bacterium]